MPIKRDDAITYNGPMLKEPLTFKVSAKLAHRLTFDEANANAKAKREGKAKHWQRDMDAWRVTITSDYPGSMELDFFTGVGHRTSMSGRPNPQMRTRYDYDEATRTMPPSAKDVLISIGGDYLTARDMPRDEADAMDYLQAELGFEGGSETLRTVRALNKMADDIRALLRHTGFDPDHFAEWCQELDQ